MFAFRRLTAVRFVKELSSGATRPCVFECEDQAGTRVGEFVVKFGSPRLMGDSNGPYFECLGAQMADFFQIPVPEPAVVELTPELGEAIPVWEQSVRERVRSNSGTRFACAYLGAGLQVWALNQPIPEPLIPAACDILAFDAVIDNADRRSDRPNLLWGEGKIWVIDHELAFGFTRLIGGPNAGWNLGGLSFLLDHPLYSGLRGQVLNFERFRDRLEAFDGTAVTRILGSIPSDFPTNFGDQILRRLSGMRESGDQLETSLRMVLR